MNIAICDDGENTRFYIRKLIEAQDSPCRVMEFSSGEELLAFWDQEDREKIDLLVFVPGNAKSEKNIEPKAVLLRDGNVTRSVPADDIYYIESNNRKIIVHTLAEVIECYGKIGELEKELQEGFFRIHKGYLVNMKYVDGYNRTEVRVKNGSSLLLSKYKYQDFAKAYLEFISAEK